MIRKETKENPSAVRLCRLLNHLEREGSIRVGEVASLLHVSSVTAAQYVTALRESYWVVLGREYLYGPQRDRKLRLSERLRFHTLSIDRTHVRTITLCPATGKCERQTLSLCDAIPTDEATAAVLHRVLDTWERDEKTEAQLGVILEDGVILPEILSFGLSARQIASRNALTVAGLARMYGEQSVLYVRYGDRPLLRLISGGVPLSDLRPSLDLQREWSDGVDTRLEALAKHTERVLSVLIPDVVVLEADGVRTESVAEGMQAILEERSTTWQATRPPLVLMSDRSVAEQECLYRLHYRLAETILAAGKQK